MTWPLHILKRAICPHDDIGENVIELEPLGVGLGWSMRPELIRQWEKTCTGCGARVKTSGYVPNRKYEDFERDAKDWPLKPSGEPYPIARSQLWEGRR